MTVFSLIECDRILKEVSNLKFRPMPRLMDCLSVSAPQYNGHEVPRMIVSVIAIIALADIVNIDAQPRSCNAPSLKMEFSFSVPDLVP